MFSFTERGSIKPIAEIKGKSELAGKFLYLHRKDPHTKELKKGFFDEITLKPSDKFEFMPEIRDNFTDTISITAPKGSGKSTLGASYAMKIKKVLGLEDDDLIVVKKSKTDDPAFKKLNPLYLYCDEEMVDNPPNLDEIVSDGRPKVILFDDIDVIQSKKLKDVVQKFLDECLCEGRKLGISTIIMAHRLAGGRDTKMILSECSYLSWFPENTTSDFKYTLQKYCDMTLDVIRDLKSSPSPWVMYHQHSPRFILTENRAVIFDLDREKDRLDDIKKEKKERRLLKRVLYPRRSGHSEESQDEEY